MTQPPDDAALVAMLRRCANGLGIMKTASGDYGIFDDAADALEAKDRRIAEMREALRLISEMQRDRFGSAARHSEWCQRTARAALEPSDKGVGR